MIYLYWYLGVGACALLSIVVSNWPTKKNDPWSLDDALESIHPERKKLRYRILNNMAEAVLLALLIVPFWPVIVFVKVKQMISGEPDSRPFEKPEFAVARSDLLEQLSIDEIEQRENVVDPLHAVPDLPFGHLNAAWKKFLEGMEPQDSIWSFSAHWTQWSRQELRLGYVIVHGDTIGQHFLTTRNEVEEQPDEDTSVDGTGDERKRQFHWVFGMDC